MGFSLENWWQLWRQKGQMTGFAYSSLSVREPRAKVFSLIQQTLINVLGALCKALLGIGRGGSRAQPGSGGRLHWAGSSIGTCRHPSYEAGKGPKWDYKMLWKTGGAETTCTWNQERHHSRVEYGRLGGILIDADEE